MTPPRFKKNPVSERHPISAMNKADLRQEVKFLRHRLGYWRDKAEEIAYLVQEGREEPKEIEHAINEMTDTLHRFVAAVVRLNS